MRSESCRREACSRKMLVTSLKRSASTPLCDCIGLIFTRYRSLRQQAAGLQGKV